MENPVITRLIASNVNKISFLRFFFVDVGVWAGMMPLAHAAMPHVITTAAPADERRYAAS